MKRSACLLATALATLTGTLIAAGPVAARAAGTQPHRAIESLARIGNKSVQSTNWSGYAAYGTTFTNAQGTWTQPAADCASVRSNSYALAAFWVGLDGYDSNTVEQTGTEADCSGREPVYYAWYELYPQRLFLIEEPVKVGDVFHAEITQGTLKLEDSTAKWTAEETYLPSGLAFSSADWIAEGPARGHLTDFGSVRFEKAAASSDEAGIKNGAIDDEAWSNDAITLVANGGPHATALATPGTLEGGTAFSIATSETEPPAHGKGH